MKNNQGFTLVGLMAIAAMLSLITIAGITMSKYNANRIEAANVQAKSSQLISNVSASRNTATLSGSGNAEFQSNLGNLDNDPNNANNPNSLLNPNNPANPNNPNSPLNPGNPANANNPNYAPPSCPSPCHSFIDPNTQVKSCIFTAIDASCLGSTPNPLPAGCTYLADGPGDPHYQPTGDAAACPNIPSCTAPFEVSAVFHECRCPDGITDCTPFGAGGGNSHTAIPIQLQPLQMPTQQSN